MIIKLENEGQLRLPASVMEALSLQDNASLDCRVDQRAILLTPVEPCNTGDFPPGRDIFISCFGSFTLYWKGKPVRIPSRKATETLALLFAERGKPLRKVYVAETLWPGADEAHAMDCLYKACGVLRRLIRHGVPLPLSWDRDTLLLDGTHIDSDVGRFEQLYLRRGEAACREAAIALYTSPFLLNEYYEWTARLEAYYDMRYLELLRIAADSASDSSAAAYYRSLLNGVC